MSQHLPISGFSARSMCLIHVLAFMSQHLCISGSSARSMSPDPCLNIHMYLRNLCKIHVSDACLIASLSSDFVALRRRNANFDRLRRVLRGPAQKKQSGRDPRERFAQAKRKFWAPETRFVWPCAGKTVRPSVSRRLLTSGVAFSVALRSKKRGGQKYAPRPKRLYPYRKNPSVWHTVWGKKHNYQHPQRGVHLQAFQHVSHLASLWNSCFCLALLRGMILNCLFLNLYIHYTISSRRRPLPQATAALQQPCSSGINKEVTIQSMTNIIYHKPDKTLSHAVVRNIYKSFTPVLQPWGNGKQQWMQEQGFLQLH